MAGPYISYNAAGVEQTGDSILSTEIKQEADEMGYIIKDVSTGQVVYPEGAE
jgi:hypothetical protein